MARPAISDDEKLALLILIHPNGKGMTKGAAAEYMDLHRNTVSGYVTDDVLAMTKGWQPPPLPPQFAHRVARGLAQQKTPAV